MWFIQCFRGDVIVNVIFKYILWIDIVCTSYRIVVRWKPHNCVDGLTTLVVTSLPSDEPLPELMATRVLFTRLRRIDSIRVIALSSAPTYFARNLCDLWHFNTSFYAYPPESPCVLYGWVPRASNWWNEKFEYVHQILHGDNFELPISENHNCMQIITSFAYCVHIIKFKFVICL